MTVVGILTFSPKFNLIFSPSYLIVRKLFFFFKERVRHKNK